MTVTDPLRAVLSACTHHAQNAAVIDGDHVTTYEALGGLIAGFAGAAAQAACDAAGDAAPRVVVAAPSSARAYGAMFGAWTAGGFYVPVNRDAPDAKLFEVLDQIAPHLIVAHPDDQARFARLCDAPVITDPTAGEAWRGEPAKAHDLAYVLFTSGSTGTPKGVAVPRGAVANYVAWARIERGLRPSDRIAQFAPLSFDISVTDVHAGLATGATLLPFTRPRDRIAPGRAVAERGVTVWNSTPSTMALMDEAGDITRKRLGGLRVVTFCGEPLAPELARAVLGACPRALVHNTYGPTEAAVAVTAARLRAETLRLDSAASVALGAPLPNVILDIDHTDGAKGELYIAGAQLAREYWNDPAKTRAAFVERVIDGRPMRAYRTGDIVERRGGRLFFIERADDQVKIDGHRVELGEVAAAVRAAGWMTCAIVMVDGRLTAVMEGSADEVGEARLRQALAERLEPWARPRRLVFQPRLPRTASDKIDAGAVARALDAGAPRR